MTEFKKYRPFFRAGMQEILSYRLDWMLYRLGDVLMAFVTYFLWRAVFMSSANSMLGGFNLDEMVIYVFLSYITSGLTYSDGNWAVAQEVKDGSIAMRLLKPVNFNFTFLFEELGQKAIGICMITIPFYIGFFIYQTLHAATVPFSLENFLIYLLSCLLAYTLNFYFNVCYGFTAFIFKNLWGSNVLKTAIISFLSGSLIPLVFFPKIVADVLSFFPFASMVYTPVMIYLGKFSGQHILLTLGLQVFWVLIFYLLSKLIWRVTITHLSVQGG